MKRYAIVRVDKLKFCPSDIEGIDDKLVCSKTKDGKSKVCVCRYGDTKEQLIRKVLQAIIMNIIRTAKVDNKKTIQILYKANYQLAKEIVEFLGVKE